MKFIGCFLYLGIGFIQVFATMDGLEHWLGLPISYAAMGASFLAYLPIVGTILGFVGAIDVWGWEWWDAALLFFGSFAFVILLAYGASFVEFVTRRKTLRP